MDFLGDILEPSSAGKSDGAPSVEPDAKRLRPDLIETTGAAVALPVGIQSGQRRPGKCQPESLRSTVSIALSGDFESRLSTRHEESKPTEPTSLAERLFGSSPRQPESCSDELCSESTRIGIVTDAYQHADFEPEQPLPPEDGEHATSTPSLGHEASKHVSTKESVALRLDEVQASTISNSEDAIGRQRREPLLKRRREANTRTYAGKSADVEHTSSPKQRGSPCLLVPPPASPAASTATSSLSAPPSPPLWIPWRPNSARQQPVQSTAAAGGMQALWLLHQSYFPPR